MSKSYEFLEKASNLLRDKADDYALFLQEADETMVKFAGSQPSIVQGWRYTELNVLVIKNKKVFITSLTNPDESSIETTIDSISKAIGKLETSEYLPELPSNKGAPKISAFDERIETYRRDPSSLMEMIYSKLEGKVELAGMMSLGIKDIKLLTSAGFFGEHSTTFFNGYFRAFVEERSGQWAYVSTYLDEKILENAIINALSYAKLSLPFIKLEDGEYDVILSPMVAGNLVSILAEMLSAFSIDNGLSFVRPDNINNQIACESLSINDVPRRTDLPFNMSFDAEGVITYDKPLIERGVLKNILHNTATARRYNTHSTGNAGWIQPMPWNLEVKEGDYDLAEMIKETRRGILFNNNWYTRFQNFITGDFSTVGRDAIIYIENGEPKGLLRKARIWSNMPFILKNISAVGKERYKIKWWEVGHPIDLPYIKVKGVRITVSSF